MEAWQQPNWYADSSLTSAAAAKILKKRLENFGPQSELSLDALRTDQDNLSKKPGTKRLSYRSHSEESDQKIL